MILTASIRVAGHAEPMYEVTFTVAPARFSWRLSGGRAVLVAENDGLKNHLVSVVVEPNVPYLFSIIAAPK